MEANTAESDKKARKKLRSFRRNVEETGNAIKSAEASIAAVDNSPNLKELADAHADIARLARHETSKLHAGDPENQQLWHEFLPACLTALTTSSSRLPLFSSVPPYSSLRPQFASGFLPFAQRQHRLLPPRVQVATYRKLLSK